MKELAENWNYQGRNLITGWKSVEGATPEQREKANIAAKRYRRNQSLTKKDGLV